MSKILVGARPSGRLHIGHYASVIKPAQELGADVLIARYHAPSGNYEEFRKQLDEYGLNVVPQKINNDLFFKLLEISPSHLLNTMPQYKAKEKTALMYTYPVLMAHDLVGYDKVIVGDDQRPHIEFARDILPRVGEICPEPTYTNFKIMDLRHPQNKMSKSDPKSCLFLDDNDYEMKIKKAVTDEHGRKNLENIFTLLGGTNIPEKNIDLKLAIISLYHDTFINFNSPKYHGLHHFKNKPIPKQTITSP